MQEKDKIILKDKLQEIYNFVEIEFDIEDKNAIEAIKAKLTIEKIEKLNLMLKNYKKNVNKLKRKEQSRLQQKKYKKIGTNLKLEEFSKYEEHSKKLNLTISAYTKKALEAFISKKNTQAIQNHSLKELDTLKAKYTNLENKVINFNKLSLLNKILYILKYKNIDL